MGKETSGIVPSIIDAAAVAHNLEHPGSAPAPVLVPRDRVSGLASQGAATPGALPGIFEGRMPEAKELVRHNTLPFGAIPRPVMIEMLDIYTTLYELCARAAEKRGRLN